MKIWAALVAFRARLSQSHRQADHGLPARGAGRRHGSADRLKVMALPLLTALAMLGMLTTAVQAESTTIATEIPKWAETVRAAGVRLD